MMPEPIVIIGSGFSGLSTAFHCAEAGYKVLVLERKEELGGYFRELKRQFPTNSCGVCFMHPSYPSYCPHIEAQGHPNIETLTNTKVLEIRKTENGLYLKINCNGGEQQLKAKAVVFATGFELFDIKKKPEYGGGLYSNVMSAIDMEREVYELFAKGQKPSYGRIAYIQCVGSRDLKLGIPYCSSFCCMYAIKQALLLKELDNDADITIFYMDIRAFGKDYERYFLEAKKKGIKFIRSAVAAVRKRPATGRLELLYTSAGEAVEDVFDTVVLSQGVGYSSETLKLLGELDIFPDFYSENPFKVKEVKQDVYITGTAFEPSDIPDSVIDGAYVASKILERDGLISQQGVLPKAKISKVKKVGLVAFGVDDTAYMKLKEHYPDMILVKNTDEVGYFIEQASLDGLVLLADDIREADAMLKSNKYFGLHVNSVMLVSSFSSDVFNEINSAVFRIKNVKKQPYQIRKLNQKVLVLGGGVAGLTAAKKLSRFGFDVILVEKETILGGRALEIQDRKDFVEQLVTEIQTENKVEVLKGYEVKKVAGRFGDFTCLAESSSEKREFKVGAILLATGATERRQLLSCENGNNIFTAFDFDKNKEKLMASKAVVMLQCVGSRTEENPVCYRVCCLKAVKNAVFLKTQNPEMAVYILHKDIRTYGFGENLYRQARALGVNFVRFSEQPQISADSERVKVSVREEGTNLTMNLDADYLILSTGVNPNTANLPLNVEKEFNFIVPYNKKSGILDISNGVFAAGLCLAPNYTDDVIKQAEAAALRIALKLSKGQILTRFDTAFVNERYCCGCELCIKACPVSARYLDEEKKIAKVDETLCEGCGTCAMVCANKASQHKLFEHKSMLKTIDLMLG